MVEARMLLGGRDAKIAPGEDLCNRLQKLKSMIFEHANYTVKKVYT